MSKFSTRALAKAFLPHALTQTNLSLERSPASWLSTNTKTRTTHSKPLMDTRLNHTNRFDIWITVVSQTAILNGLIIPVEITVRKKPVCIWSRYETFFAKSSLRSTIAGPHRSQSSANAKNRFAEAGWPIFRSWINCRRLRSDCVHSAFGSNSPSSVSMRWPKPKQLSCVIKNRNDTQSSFGENAIKPSTTRNTGWWSACQRF